MSGFMRGGPARSYEQDDAYGLRFVSTGPNAGWTAITQGDDDVAYFHDGVMATVIRDLLNFAARKSK